MILSQLTTGCRRLAARVLIVGTALVLAVCGESPTETPQITAIPGDSPAPPTYGGEDTDDRSLVPANVPLPFAGSVNSSGSAFKITQTGAGRAGEFRLDNPSSSNQALRVSTMGGSGYAILAFNSSSGPGSALYAQKHGNGGSAGFFEIPTPSSSANAVVISSRGSGTALRVRNLGTGRAGEFSSSARPLLAELTNSGGDIAVFRGGSPFIGDRARIDATGKGFFNGGTQTGGADVAEALAVEGAVGRYEPGDVLVISTRADRRVARTRERYSTRVAGVYATKPGVLLTDRGIEDPLSGLVPVGVLGVIPTKVSTENGPIRRGDLLVTASRPGHAMRASPVVVQGVTLYPTGAILGRAMEEFRGPGTGRIRVLVNVK